MDTRNRLLTNVFLSQVFAELPFASIVEDVEVSQESFVAVSVSTHYLGSSLLLFYDQLQV